MDFESKKLGSICAWFALSTSSYDNTAVHLWVLSPGPGVNPHHMPHVTREKSHSHPASGGQDKVGGTSRSPMAILSDSS
jgi:hypothetical protein